MTLRDVIEKILSEVAYYPIATREFVLSSALQKILKVECHDIVCILKDHEYVPASSIAAKLSR